MNGKVEVFCILSDGSHELLYKEDNLTVDGAGESIVDMLTTPSSMLPIMPRIFDTSNWGIKALSFGAAKENFGLNPDRPTTSCSFDDASTIVGAPANYMTAELLASPTFWTNADRSDAETRIVRALYVSASVEDSTASSYTPPYKMPGYPAPLNKKLEDASTAYAVFSGDGTQSYGHFENRIQYNQSDASAYSVGAYAVGRDPLGTNNFWVALVSSIDGDFVADRTLNIVASADEIGSVEGYNGKDSGNVDYRGFIRVETVSGAEDNYSSWDPNTNNTQWVGRAWVSGLGVQTNPVDFVTDPKIRVTTTLHGDDLNMFNMYGGLHQMGLWSFDMKKCLGNSNPPYDWNLDSNGANDREYRLFAKKTFTDNLSRIADVGNSPGIDSYASLLIKWTIDLRSYK
jgi:hypothetical protein